jgi:GDPmannose 4,6-dehydratase
MGNLEARRDWGYAGDYVQAMWRMLQQDRPDDYVIATGKTYSVKDLIELAFSQLQLDWKEWVVVDEQLYRPSEIHDLRGDHSKASRELGWEPTMSFDQLIRTMVDEDFEKLKSAKS